MRRANLWLPLVILEVFVIFPSLLMMTQASPVSGIGIGIRKDGPVQAYVGDTIVYSITVYNLGDYWITSAAVTDTFPNGTSSLWNVPDLAPVGQLGNSFNISGILYTIQEKDVVGGNPSYVINHAEAVGYSGPQGLNVSVFAETNYVTSVLARGHIPVGGYSIGIKATNTSTPTTVYTNLLFIMTAVFSMSSLYKRKVYHDRKTASERAR